MRKGKKAKRKTVYLEVGGSVRRPKIRVTKELQSRGAIWTEGEWFEIFEDLPEPRAFRGQLLVHAFDEVVRIERESNDDEAVTVVIEDGDTHLFTKGFRGKSRLKTLVATIGKILKGPRPMKNLWTYLEDPWNGFIKTEA